MWNQAHAHTHTHTTQRDWQQPMKESEKVFPEGYGKKEKRNCVTDWIHSINKLPRFWSWCCSNFHMNIFHVPHSRGKREDFSQGYLKIIVKIKKRSFFLLFDIWKSFSCVYTGSSRTSVSTWCSSTLIIRWRQETKQKSLIQWQFHLCFAGRKERNFPEFHPSPKKNCLKANINNTWVKEGKKDCKTADVKLSKSWQ